MIYKAKLTISYLRAELLSISKRNLTQRVESIILLRSIDNTEIRISLFAMERLFLISNLQKNV